MHTPRRVRRALRAVGAGGVAAAAAAASIAVAPSGGAAEADAVSFDRVATFYVDDNGSEVAEIVDATKDGMTLVYGDSGAGAVGLVDITDPTSPQPAGTIDAGGEVTSVAVLGNEYVLAGVNESESYTEPAGSLKVFDLASGEVAATHDLGGQPDAVVISPDGRYAVVAIENERDEEVTVDGVEGGLPQDPPGYVVIVDLVGAPDAWTTRTVDLTGFGAYAPEDPEPEYVAISGINIAAVTLQENNGVVLIWLPTGVAGLSWDAGTVDLEGVDATEDDVISLTESLADVPREPDAIAWTEGAGIVTANEGDLFGGSRGFSVFDFFGDVLHDSGSSFEELAVRIGHYPESRSENKGSEPEGVTTGRFGEHSLIFVGAERANFVGVYEYLSSARPAVFRQALPTGIGPEGLKAIGDRGLLVVANEVADPEEGIRSSVMIYQLTEGAPAYPMIVSADGDDGTPIPWGALSGLAGDPGDADTVYAVQDSYYGESRIFTVDVSAAPAVITDATFLTLDGERVDLDLEGVAVRPGGGWWVASEGSGAAPEAETPNQLLSVDPDGTIVDVVELPDEVVAIQANNGFEGVGVTGEGDDTEVWVAFQRAWGDEDVVRIGRYTPATGEWAFIGYELDEPTSPNGGWVGLSELTVAPDGTMLILERDNQLGPDATIKKLYAIDPSSVEPVGVGAELPVVDKVLHADLLDDLANATNGVLQEKVEGVALTADGVLYGVTDNDGVDGSTGETVFWEIGPYEG